MLYNYWYDETEIEGVFDSLEKAKGRAEFLTKDMTNVYKKEDVVFEWKQHERDSNNNIECYYESRQRSELYFIRKFQLNVPITHA